MCRHLCFRSIHTRSLPAIISNNNARNNFNLVNSNSQTVPPMTLARFFEILLFYAMAVAVCVCVFCIVYWRLLNVVSTCVS